ncbi:MAG: 23S rRNA (pseudouridine(1915)-N(3))-methyltransferase RlmH [Candidatus Taylorbacteria bacterium]|nr:23S rRNA (pseudouridine(1915)-N(3))-methyltransferase RlmH [Candidatus Taylorbacteria bacterium]
MKIIFITIGKDTDKNLAESVIDYTNRINRHIKTEWKIIPSSDIKKESESILKNIESGDYLVVLDERGKSLSTIELADFVEKRMIASDKRIVFVVGGAYGVDEEVLQRANFIWSLSKLTFPHQLVRLILSESIYRAISVIKKEPYHHS